MTFRASAPASAANLGPGFDVIAIALPPRCAVTATASKEWAIASPGLDDHAEAFRVAHSMADGLGVPGPWQLDVASQIPVARGLGSSAAFAVAAGAAMVAATRGAFDRNALVRVGAETEGHADNIAAAVHGGLVVASPDRQITQLPFSDDLSMVIGIPAVPLATPLARSVLSPGVSRRVATRTVARALLLAEALRTASRDAGALAGGDELHEEARGEISPVTSAMVEAAVGAGAIHAAWSGAGPSAIAFVRADDAEAVAAAVGAVLSGAGTVERFEIERRGVSVG